MTREEELEAKIDALLKEFSDLEYSELADIFEYYAGSLKTKDNVNNQTN